MQLGDSTRAIQIEVPKGGGWSPLERPIPLPQLSGLPYLSNAQLDHFYVRVFTEDCPPVAGYFRVGHHEACRSLVP
jgi:hypothetical protein